MGTARERGQGRMWFQVFAVLAILANSSPTAAEVYSCIGCSSNDGDNVNCERTPQSENMFKFSGSWMWIRNCCMEGNIGCPTDGSNHDEDEVTEVWRARCDSDNCNTMDPRFSDGSD